MKPITQRNQFKTMEHLYLKLSLALKDNLFDSKKQKAYYLFTVLFSEGWWVEDNVEIVKEAVRNHSLNLVWERRDPDERDDDNIHIYFLENEKGKNFIVLVLDSIDPSKRPELLDMIPVKRNDYEMTRIYPRPVSRKLKSTSKKNIAIQKS